MTVCEFSMILIVKQILYLLNPLHVHVQTGTSSTTYMDELFKDLLSKSDISNDAYAKFKAFVDLEEYDTESIEMDAGDDGQGNVCAGSFGKKILAAVIMFVRDNKSKLYKEYILYRLRLSYKKLVD